MNNKQHLEHAQLQLCDSIKDVSVVLGQLTDSEKVCASTLEKLSCSTNNIAQAAHAVTHMLVNMPETEEASPINMNYTEEEQRVLAAIQKKMQMISTMHRNDLTKPGGHMLLLHSMTEKMHTAYNGMKAQPMTHSHTEFVDSLLNALAVYALAYGSMTCKDASK